MANRPATVTVTEIKRTLQGALAAGFAVGRVEVDHVAGKVVIFPLGAASGLNGPDPDELMNAR